MYISALSHSLHTSRIMTKTAVVVGATNGIGKAISCRLANEGFQVIAVGRGREGRAQEVVDNLAKCTADGRGEEVKHEFRACDAFQLSQVKECAEGIARDFSGDKGGVDALVMTQGMATIQGFTPTSEGNDEKLTLHYWSRASFTSCLLPSLRASAASNSTAGGPVVLSVLSGGVHSPYNKYASDPELRDNYSIKNAADIAGYYNDLFFDSLAHQQSNRGINFIHAAPGFVSSNWGTEMPMLLKGPIRMIQKMGGKSPDKCASFMVDPILKASVGRIDMKRPGDGEGVYIMNEDATGGTLTKKGHTREAMDSCWNVTKDVLGRSGITLED